MSMEEKNIPNLSKLHEGMIVKNYKEMCYLLGEHYYDTGGRVKENQIERWSRFFKYKRIGHEWFIETILDQPLNEVSKIRTVYAGIIESMITDYFNRSKCDEIKSSNAAIAQAVGLTDLNFYLKRHELYNQSNTNPEEVYFIQRVGNKLNDTIISAIESMKSRSLITYQYEPTVKVIDDIHETIVERPMTEAEISSLNSITQDVINEYGKMYKIPNPTIQDIYIKELSFYFNKRLFGLLLEKHPYIVNYFKRLKIAKTNDKQAIPLRNIDINGLSDDEKKLEINNRFCEALEIQMKSRQNKYQVKYGHLINENKLNKLPKPVITDEFVRNQNKLLDNYVRLKNHHNSILNVTPIEYPSDVIFSKRRGIFSLEHE